MTMMAIEMSITGEKFKMHIAVVNGESTRTDDETGSCFI
jgi:hypothetical protein